jgi:hypothetical protein
MWQIYQHLWMPLGLRFDHRIFEAARRAPEDVVIERLLPEDFFQQHLTRAHGTRRFVDLRHDSSLSADADPIGFVLWWGMAD